MSYTLGPQSSFSCPAVTRNVARDQTSVYTTYAVIEAANDVAVEDGGRIVWVWSQDSSQDSLSNPTGQKRSGTVRLRVKLCLHTLLKVHLFSGTS